MIENLFEGGIPVEIEALGNEESVQVESKAITALIQKYYESEQGLSFRDLYELSNDILNEGISLGTSSLIDHLNITVMKDGKNILIRDETDPGRYDITSWMKVITRFIPDLSDIYTTLARHTIIEKNVGDAFFGIPTNIYQLDNGEYVELQLIDDLVQDTCNCKSAVPVFVHRGFDREKVLKDVEKRTDTWLQRANRDFKPTLKEPQKEYVYVVQFDESDLFKIGRTTNMGMRLTSLQTSCPYEIRLSYLFEVSDMSKCEIDLHNKYNASKVRGEWFRLTSNDLSELVNYVEANWTVKSK